MEEKKPARLRPWYLYQILLEQTDDLHALTREELSDALAARGILTERKTIYADLALLREAGVDLIQEKKGHQTYYHIGSRMFELPELKLLVDLVLASRFITKKKSEALIEKLGKLTSVYEAHQLQRQVTVAGRIKAENEQIYYNVDRIHTGINEDRKLHFQYFQWLPDKQKLLRHEGRRYTVSPWALSWDHEKYYLIGYDSDSAMIRHYRVDKILNLEVSEEPREGMEAFQSYDLSTYSARVFSMFDGEEQTVRLRFDRDLANVILDQFGQEIEIESVKDGLFETVVNVEVSPQFLAWILSLGSGIRITEPPEVVEEVRKLLRDRTRLYRE